VPERTICDASARPAVVFGSASTSFKIRRANALLRFFKSDGPGYGDGGPRFNGLLGKSRMYYHHYFRRIPRKFILPAGVITAYSLRSGVKFGEEDLSRSRLYNIHALQAEHKAQTGHWAH